MKNQRQSNQLHDILFISALDFWSMGNGKGGPALWQNLMNYAKNKRKVKL